MAFINGNEDFLIALKGDSAFIRYSAYADGTDFTEERREGQNYIGFASGQTAPTDKSGYSWGFFDAGDVGDVGDIVQTLNAVNAHMFYFGNGKTPAFTVNGGIGTLNFSGFSTEEGTTDAMYVKDATGTLITTCTVEDFLTAAKTVSSLTVDDEAKTISGFSFTFVWDVVENALKAYHAYRCDPEDVVLFHHHYGSITFGALYDLINTSTPSGSSLPEVVMIKDFAATMYFEGDKTGYNPMYFKCEGKMYLRGGYSINFAGTDIAEQLADYIVTSPRGVAGCLEIPHNYSLLIDTNMKFSICKTTENPNDKFPIFKVSTGQSWGGIGQNIYLQETFKGHGSSDGSDDIAAYFAAEVENCVQKVQDACTEKSLVFAVVTDSHYSGSTSHNWHNTVKNIKAVNKRIKFDGIYHLGDLIPGNLEKSASLALLSEMREELYNINPESYLIPGNHDDNAWYDETNHTGLISKDDWYSILCRYKDVDVNRAGNNVYWYKDMPSFGVRVICLDSHLGDGTYGQGSSWGFPAEEVEWVRDVALNTQNKVIFFSHIPLTQEFNAYNRNPTNGAELSAIINAFIGAGGTVIGFFHGHTHWDYISKKDTNSFYEVSTGASYTTTNYGTYKPDDAVVQDRAAGTLTEDLWDIVVVQPDEGIVRIIRFGAGNDREVTFTIGENSNGDNESYTLTDGDKDEIAAIVLQGFTDVSEVGR